MNKLMIIPVAAATAITVYAQETVWVQEAPAVPAAEVSAPVQIASGEVVAEDVKTVNSDIKFTKTGQYKLDEAFEKFALDKGVSYGEITKEGRLYSKGSSVVAVDAASPEFVKARSMAYEKAYLNALSQFIVDFYGFQKMEKINSYSSDNSSDVAEAPEAKSLTVDEKVELLTDAKLDKALAQEGVPESKYAGAGIAAKRQIFKDAISSSVFNEAFHASNGCVPVQTFESHGEDGRYYIGVVVRYDRVSKTISDCIRRKVRPGLVKEGGLSVAEALPPAKDMLDNFGVRLYYDQSGLPTLLSFGQWGSSYTGKNPVAIDRGRQNALMQAKNIADSGLTMFINSNATISEDSNIGETVELNNVFKDNGVSEEEIYNVLDKLRKNIKAQGSDSLSGRTTVYERVLPHSSGREVAIVVRRWSFSTYDSIKELEAPVPQKQVQPKPPAPKTDAGIRKGRIYDF